jgi:hypothetical protein
MATEPNRPCPRRGLAQQVAIKAIIIITEECGLATISALGNVMRNAGHDEASNTSHGGTMVG